MSGTIGVMQPSLAYMTLGVNETNRTTRLLISLNWINLHGTSNQGQNFLNMYQSANLIPHYIEHFGSQLKICKKPFLKIFCRSRDTKCHTSSWVSDVIA